MWDNLLVIWAFVLICSMCCKFYNTVFFWKFIAHCAEDQKVSVEQSIIPYLCVNFHEIFSSISAASKVLWPRKFRQEKAFDAYFLKNRDTLATSENSGLLNQGNSFKPEMWEYLISPTPQAYHCSYWYSMSRLTSQREIHSGIFWKISSPFGRALLLTLSPLIPSFNTMHVAKRR